MPRPVRIIEENPQSPPAAIPGFASRVRFNSSGRTVTTCQTMAAERPIPISSGELLIVNEGRPGATGSNLTLTAPQRRDTYEQGADGAVLKIISAVPLKHRIRTPPNVLNGRADTILLDGIGASVELYAHAGLWLVLSSTGAEIT